MKFITFTIVLVALSSTSLADDDVVVEVVPGGKSGVGTTTRYWDCCKPSCAWVENIKTPDMTAVTTCAVDGLTVVNASVQSGCIGGDSFMCNNQQPWAVNESFALGFAAASFTGGADTNLCCACFSLKFTSGPLANQQMILQNTNTGGDLGANQFDIALPGGGVGIFTEGCMTQWNTPSNGWGDQYGGVGSETDCDSMPEELQPGCKFRFEWFKNADNPQIEFTQVTCPKQLVDVSGCSL